MESAHIPPRVSDARELADFVQSHFNTCSVCKGAVCETLLRDLRKLPLDEILSLIEQLGPQEKTYFEEKVLDILKAALSPPPAPQNVNPEPPPQQEYVGRMTRQRAAQLGQQQQPQPPRQQQPQPPRQQQPQPHQQQQQQQQPQPPRQKQPQPPRQQQPQPPHQQQPQPPHQQQPQPHQQQQQQQQPQPPRQKQPQPPRQQQPQPPHQQQPQPHQQQQQQQQPQPPRQKQPQPPRQQQPQPPHQQQPQPPHQQQPQPHQQQQQQQPQPHQQQQQQPQPLHQQQPQKSQTPSPLDSASSTTIKSFNGKVWRRLTKYLNPNLLIVQVEPNGFIELCIDDRRPNDGARCTTEACKNLNVYYRINDNKIVDDPRLGHHNTCKLKNADAIREEQFCREFLLKVAARMVPPELDEFEKVFKAKFGEARFTDLYGTRAAQSKFKKRISAAYKSEVGREEMEKIWGKMDDFNPDDEEDVEETEPTDGQLNEMLHNMTLSDEAESSTTTTTTAAASSSASASSAETSATSSSSTTTTTAASSSSTSTTTTTMLTEENNVDAETQLREAVGTLSGFEEYISRTFDFVEGKKLGEGGYSDVYQGILKRNQRPTAVKIIPYRQEHMDTKFNESLMASAAGILPEFLITKALSSLPGENFLKLYDAAIVKGKYPQILLDLFDNYNGKKYNESPLKIDAENQTYLVLSLTLAGPELEKETLKETGELLSILAQVCFADAVAESVLEFEHRDQHVSNIFIEATKKPEITVELNGKTFGIKTFGKLARVADYGNSRLKLENSIICKDLEKEDLADGAADTDLHQQVYRQMLPILRNNGKDFTPKTSVLWLQYLIQKLTKYEGKNSSKFSNKPPKTGVKLTSRKEISKELCDGVAVLPNAQAVAKYFESHKLFKGIITRKV